MQSVGVVRSKERRERTNVHFGERFLELPEVLVNCGVLETADHSASLSAVLSSGERRESRQVSVRPGSVRLISRIAFQGHRITRESTRI